MSLVTCPFCNYQISDQAEQCPRCQYEPTEEDKFKFSAFKSSGVKEKNNASTPSKYKHYKIVYVVESGLGTIAFGSSGLPLQKIESVLNKEAAAGWEVVFQVIESKRFWLFWKRDALIITLGKQ